MARVNKNALKEEEMVMVRIRVPMDYPLPRRNWVRNHDDTGWYSLAWTPDSYAAAKANHLKTVSRIVPKRLKREIELIAEVL